MPVERQCSVSTRQRHRRRACAEARERRSRDSCSLETSKTLLLINGGVKGQEGACLVGRTWRKPYLKGSAVCSQSPCGEGRQSLSTRRTICMCQDTGWKAAVAYRAGECPHASNACQHGGTELQRTGVRQTCMQGNCRRRSPPAEDQCRTTRSKRCDCIEVLRESALTFVPGASIS